MRKKDQYQSITDLQVSLLRLFSSIGYYPEKISIDSPNGMVRFLKEFVNSGPAVKYIDMLKEQADQAVSLFGDIKQERQREKNLMEEQKNQIQLYEKQIAEQKKQIAKQESQITEQEGQIVKQKSRIAEQESQIMEAKKSAEGNAEKELEELIGNLISFRDNQLIKRGFLYEQGEQEGSPPIRIVESILKESASLLTKTGVEIMEDEGMFSSDRQTIVDTIETEDDKLDGVIAEVVRPGYSYKGEPLRGQEVIIYKYKKKSEEK